MGNEGKCPVVGGAEGEGKYAEKSDAIRASGIATGGPIN